MLLYIIDVCQVKGCYQHGAYSDVAGSLRVTDMTSSSSSSAYYGLVRRHDSRLTHYHIKENKLSRHKTKTKRSKAIPVHDQQNVPILKFWRHASSHFGPSSLMSLMIYSRACPAVPSVIFKHNFTIKLIDPLKMMCPDKLTVHIITFKTYYKCFCNPIAYLPAVAFIWSGATRIGTLPDHPNKNKKK